MRLEIVLVATALLVLFVIVEALRRRRLSENFALLWIGVGAGALLLALLRPLVDSLSKAAGISYGPTLVFTAIAVFLLIMCLWLSVHVTRLNRRVEMLAQELALHHVREPDHGRGDIGPGTPRDDDGDPARDR